MKHLLFASRLACGALSAACLSGCATILAGGPDRIAVNSEPTGAIVELDGRAVGQTPTIVTIERPDDCRLTIRKAGYETVLVDRDKVVNGWLFANFAIGAIWIVVDLATSNQGKYSEDPIFVRLTPDATALQRR